MSSQTSLFDRHSTAIVIPRLNEQFVIPQGHTSEIILINKNTPEDAVKVAPSNPEMDQYDVLRGEPNGNIETLVAENIPLKQALTIAADIQGFVASANGEHLLPGCKEVQHSAEAFTLDPQEQGGLLITDPETHLPLRVRAGQVETRVKCVPTGESNAKYDGRYICERRTVGDDTWTGYSDGSHPVHPPVIFNQHFKGMFHTWAPMMGIPFKQRVDEVARVQS